jgi:hypothetical protein
MVPSIIRNTSFPHCKVFFFGEYENNYITNVYYSNEKIIGGIHPQWDTESSVPIRTPLIPTMARIICSRLPIPSEGEATAAVVVLLGSDALLVTEALWVVVLGKDVVARWLVVATFEVVVGVVPLPYSQSPWSTPLSEGSKKLYRPRVKSRPL